MGVFNGSTWVCLPCQMLKGVKCQTTFPWLIDCSGLTSSTTPTKKECESCNRRNIYEKLLDIAVLVLPFGAAYGDWLGGVTDPDLNLTLKAMAGTFVADLAFELFVGEKVDPNTKKQDQPNPVTRTVIDVLAIGGWVLMAQVVQDFIFHGAPNRFIGALVAGLANYYRKVGSIPFKVSGEQVGGLVIFGTAMASFAGNWSMMGDNVMSRFISCAFASFLSFFSPINNPVQKCIYYNQLWPKEVIIGALQLGLVSGLIGTLTQSALGKPVVSGLASGCAALWAANKIFNGKEFSKCSSSS